MSDSLNQACKVGCKSDFITVDTSTSGTIHLEKNHKTLKSIFFFKLIYFFFFFLDLPDSVVTTPSFNILKS